MFYGGFMLQHPQQSRMRVQLGILLAVRCFLFSIQIQRAESCRLCGSSIAVWRPRLSFYEPSPAVWVVLVPPPRLQLLSSSSDAFGTFGYMLQVVVTHLPWDWWMLPMRVLFFAKLCNLRCIQPDDPSWYQRRAKQLLSVSRVFCVRPHRHHSVPSHPATLDVQDFESTRLILLHPPQTK